MKVPMSIVRYNYGRWGERKVRAGRTGNRGRPRSTKLRNKKGYKDYLDAYSV